MALSPDGLLLASGEFDGGVTLWNALTGEKLFDLQKRETQSMGYAPKLTFLKNGEEILVSPYGKPSVIYDSKTGMYSRRAPWSQEYLNQITVSSDSTFAILPDDQTNANGRVQIWDFKSEQLSHQIPGFQYSRLNYGNCKADITFTGAALLPGSSKVVLSYSTGTLRLWNLFTDETIDL